MISTLELAQLSKRVYTESPGSWDNYWSRDDIVMAHKRTADENVIVFRGSATLEDWKHDLDGWPNSHPDLGWCHSGFLKDMDNALFRVMGVCDRPHIAITGHSLGAARALILTAMLSLRKLKVSRVSVFGAPKPGFQKLSNIINQSGAQVEIYRNRSDPVTFVPWFMGMYKHPVEPIQLDVGHTEYEIPPLCDHFMTKYVEGITNRA